MRSTPLPTRPDPAPADPSRGVPRGPGQALRALIALGLGLLLAVGSSLVLPATEAAAAVRRPFEPYYSTQTNGDISITGNTLMTCSATAPNCTAALAGTFVGGNNDFTMQPLDADSDPTTTSSSGATVTVPDGARVLYAGLFWGASVRAGTNGTAATNTAVDKIRLRTPGAAAYQTVTATRAPDRLGDQNSDYSSYADITSLVRTAGTGMYWGADSTAATGVDRYAGWAIVLVVSHPSLPLRDLNVFGGYASVQTNETITTTLSGFLTPATGTVNARFGTVTYEGDRQISGDYLTVGDTRLADAASPSSNFFDSVVANKGAPLTNRTPANVNNMALDAKVLDAPGVVPNGATSTNVTFGTGGDFYYPAALTTQIDLYAPTIKGAKSVVNLSGNDVARVGDVLEYSTTFTNTGQDPADAAVMRDTLPTTLAYQPGSLQITGAGAGPKTDAAGDDQAEVDGQTVQARLGTGATATAGGRLANGDTATVRFRAVVQPNAAGTTVVNTAVLDYRAATLGKPYSYTTNDTRTPVAPRADVAITKSGPATLVAGQQVRWELTVRNEGPNPAADTAVTDTLPAGVRFDSATGADCNHSSGTLTCALGTLAPGATRTITVLATVPPDSTATTLPNTASVSTSTSDPQPGNDVASSLTTLTRQADLALTKSVSPTNPVPGTQVVWTLTTTNNGPSTAVGARLSDVLPDGLSIVGDPTTTVGSCRASGVSVDCALGDLAVGQRATVTVTTRLAPSWTGMDPLTNRASVSSDTTDPALANNSAAASITPAAPSADLRTTKAVVGRVQAGTAVTYRVDVTNAGPSRATGVTVVDQLPAGLTDATASSASGDCTVVGGRVSCTLEDMPVGATATVNVRAQVAASAIGTLTNTARAAADTADPDPGNNQATVSSPVLASTDLSLGKSADRTVVNAGDTVTYTLTAHNAGLADAREVTITDSLPSPLEVRSATASRGTCSISGRSVSCALGTLPADAEATVTVVTRLPADATATTLTNSAEVATTTQDTNPDNNRASFTLGAQSAADLAIAKSSSGPMRAGEPVRWVLEVVNNGPSNAATVVVTDRVPAGVGSVTASSPDLACQVADGTVTCRTANLAAGARTTVQVSGTLAPDYAQASITNTATVTSATVDPTLSNNTDVAIDPVASTADLRLTKTGPGRVVAGEQITWDVQVSNSGPSTARNVVVDDLIPTGVGSITVDDDRCRVNNHQLRCTLDTLAPAATARFRVTGTVDAATPAGTELRNNAAVSASTPDADPANNQAAVTTVIDTRADLAVRKTVTPDQLIAGAPAAYVLSVTNAGPSTASNARVEDTLPAGVTFVTASESTCAATGQRVECTVGDLGPGMTRTVRLEVTIAADAPPSLTNTARASSETPDPDPSNDTATLTSAVNRSADVVLTKTADGDAAAGEAVTYTLIAQNAGPSPAEAVELTDTLPAQMTILSAPDCTITGQRVSCPIGTLAPGAAASRTVTARIASDAPAGPVTNAARTASSTPDPEPANNDSAATIRVINRADVSITKSAQAETTLAGQEATWSVVVANAGPSIARDVVVTDTVPAPLRVISARLPGGAPCQVAQQQVTCALGDLPVGQAAITIVATVPANHPGGDITNSAGVTTATDDPTPGDHTTSVTTQVSRRADLSVTKTMSPNPPVPGSPVTFTITATNNGPATADDVSITDTLPPSVVGATATGENGTCSVTALDDQTSDEVDPNGGQVSCGFGDLQPGQSVTVVITGRVARSVTGELQNTAYAGSTTPDPVSENNSATVSGRLEPSADMSLTKVLTEQPVPGGTVRWVLRARNDGPSTATGVTVTDRLPDQVTVVSATTTHDGGTCTVTGQEVSCALGSVRPPATAEVVITGRVSADAVGDLTNVATVTTTTPDTDPGNNTATSNAPLTPNADLEVTKRPGSPQVLVGGRLDWQVTLTNHGPSLARGVVVTDRLPAGLVPAGDVVAPAGFTCTVADGQLTCRADQLPVGGPVQIVVPTTVIAGAAQVVANTATVTADTPDAVPGNNTGTAEVTVLTPIPSPTPGPTPSATLTPSPTPTVPAPPVPSSSVPGQPLPPAGPAQPGPDNGSLSDTGSVVGPLMIAVVGVLLVGGVVFLALGRARRRS